MDPANERAYEVHKLRCHACAARDRMSADLQADESFEADGLLLAVTKRPGR